MSQVTRAGQLVGTHINEVIEIDQAGAQSITKGPLVYTVTKGEPLAVIEQGNGERHGEVPDDPCPLTSSIPFTVFSLNQMVGEIQGT